MRGATGIGYELEAEYWISTHAPLAGRDSGAYTGSCTILYFNPRAPCGARQSKRGERKTLIIISTHAPLAGRDYGDSTTIYIGRNFNPRAPCGARPLRIYKCREQRDFNPRAPCGARRLTASAAFRWCLFQPTRPLRGATRARGRVSTDDDDFNPRAPCGARLSALRNDQESSDISTHAPLAGRDNNARDSENHEDEFQPTRPLRGATVGAGEPT